MVSCLNYIDWSITGHQTGEDSLFLASITSFNYTHTVSPYHRFVSRTKMCLKSSLCLVFFQYFDVFFFLHMLYFNLPYSFPFMSFTFTSTRLNLTYYLIPLYSRRVFILRDSVSGETQGYSWNHVWWFSQIDWGYTLQPLQHTITISPIWLTAPVLHPPIQSLLTWSLSSPAQTADNKSFQNFCLWSLCCQTMG